MASSKTAAATPATAKAEAGASAQEQQKQLIDIQKQQIEELQSAMTKRERQNQEAQKVQ